MIQNTNLILNIKKYSVSTRVWSNGKEAESELMSVLSGGTKKKKCHLSWVLKNACDFQRVKLDVQNSRTN